MISYQEKDLLGGWSIGVLKGVVTVGHIRRLGQDGGYVYYPGPNNQLNWSLHADDIDSLKEKIEGTIR
jgi:hypothetical protein